MNKFLNIFGISMLILTLPLGAAMLLKGSASSNRPMAATAMPETFVKEVKDQDAAAASDIGLDSPHRVMVKLALPKYKIKLVKRVNRIRPTSRARVFEPVRPPDAAPAADLSKPDLSKPDIAHFASRRNSEGDIVKPKIEAAPKEEEANPLQYLTVLTGFLGAVSMVLANGAKFVRAIRGKGEDDAEQEEATSTKA